MAGEQGCEGLPPLVVLVGPTGVGKSAVAVELALLTGGEVVSADSMQVYRGLDIGTDKIPPAERRGVPHHLLDVVPPDHTFTVAEYQALAVEVIREIHARGRLPILVGGTGLYVRAVVDGGLFPDPGPHPEIRERLRREAEERGYQHLYERLAEVDPEAAARLHPRDLRRVIRALEVYEATGQPISLLQKRWRSEKPRYDAVFFGLTMDRARLYCRIEERVERQFARGLVREVEALWRAGYFRRGTARQALGYKEILGYLEGQYDLETAKRILKAATRHYAKRQYTWFRRDARITWLDVEAFPSPRAVAEEMVRLLGERRKDFLGAPGAEGAYNA
ncbi:MAG: tRNA (adenosine(37)-N6)-dimethylallyltransferase MiaA [Bacillota bacterium]|nr:tRNA (adenosine(37)-N6)-dimethylallyltransferase MiaA [Bacillota bacterium]